ncbi:GDP-mannose--glycolipid 4-beta-D-mannosyltransferase [Mycobacterium sp. NAZ190054]|uniref:GDP-mannose--glycolipid 4-beta-D-mannosyltransferase n=1 Tax=Mycobacterium sp. NAZ190054 TaxID=1747766 RepID=UPI0012E3F1A2|nr:GDP-mannose--glycolipid 4-beta-D-mannosyltransferase [Mycobacterium sp. NAZ190054]
MPAPGPDVNFIDSIVAHAPDDVEFRFFSWRTALFGQFDVFHVHWPEYLMRHRYRSAAFVRRIFYRVFLFRLTLKRIPVVRTVHNIQPHDSGDDSESRLLGRLDQLTRTHVVMNDCTPVAWQGRTVQIPHGDYREPFDRLPREPKVPGRVLLFGKIRPYKGVVELIRAAEDITAPGVEIRIVGHPTPAMRVEVESELAKPARRGAQVSVDLRMVPDRELVREILRAELIVLPYQNAGNGNSGVAMLALSLDRPILTPRSCVMERLAEEVGAQWIHMTDSDISGTEIESALARVRELPLGASPRFIGRDWPTIASSYAEVFRTAASDAL